MNFEICHASTPEQIAQVRTLFEEYAAWLDIDLCFQGFSQELANLPGEYAPPRGRLLLAEARGQPAACIALRPHGANDCELKRLYVRPEFRNLGLGRRLAEKVVADARSLGYATMWLDTLPSMTGAIGLYEALGFARCPAYYATPIQDTVFMKLLLRR